MIDERRKEKICSICKQSNIIIIIISFVNRKNPRMCYVFTANELRIFAMVMHTQTTSRRSFAALRVSVNLVYFGDEEQQQPQQNEEIFKLLSL